MDSRLEEPPELVHTDIVRAVDEIARRIGSAADTAA
jgi:hypothetical protein